MKIKDIIDYYKMLQKEKVSVYQDWSYYSDQINKWLEKEIEIKKGEQYED